MSENNQNNHLKIGELPVLKIVPMEKLVFHEDPDDERLLRLVSRLGSDGVLKNPPIVAEFSRTGRYVILDGANRVTALTKLGFKDLAVQVVQLEDPLLELYCWNHAVDKLDRPFFEKELEKIKGLDIRNQTLENARSDDDPDFLCHFIFNDNHGMAVSCPGDIIEKVHKLNSITSLYIHSPLSDRVSYINLEHLRRHYPNFSALLTFRRFTKAEFLEIVESGAKLPAGVTRVFLPKRALGLNIPLVILQSQLTIEDKNRWLDELILHMVRNKTIRFYREATFVFDE